MITSSRVNVLRDKVCADYNQYLAHAGIHHTRTAVQLRHIFEAYADTALPENPADYEAMFAEDNNLYDPARVRLDLDNESNVVDHMGVVGIVHQNVRIYLIGALFETYYNRFKGRRAVMVTVGPGEDEVEITNIVPEEYLPFNQPDLL